MVPVVPFIFLKTMLQDMIFPAVVRQAFPGLVRCTVDVLQCVLIAFRDFSPELSFHNAHVNR